MKAYTTWGPVRGCCNHAHQTPETAMKCLAQDRRGCKNQGGYSDWINMTPADLKNARLRLGFRSRKDLAGALAKIGFPVSWRTIEGWEQGHPRSPIPRWLSLALEKIKSPKVCPKCKSPYWNTPKKAG